MLIEKNIPLKPLNTFGINVVAREFASVESTKDLAKILNTNKSNLLVIGGGSNILLTKDVDALVLHINIKGIEIVSVCENNVRVRVAAGENWHEILTLDINLNEQVYASTNIVNSGGGNTNLTIRMRNTGNGFFDSCFLKVSSF